MTSVITAHFRGRLRARRPLKSCRVLAWAALALSAGTFAQSALHIENAWVRAMPPTQRMTAAYMTLHNTGSTALTVSGAYAAGGDASLHATRRDGDRRRMAPVESLTLEPGERVELAPGGLHLMLMSMVRVPIEGQTLEVCLDMGAVRQCVDAPVRRDGPAEEDDHAH